LLNDEIEKKSNLKKEYKKMTSGNKILKMLQGLSKL
jgi:hypothetical protein